MDFQVQVAKLVLVKFGPGMSRRCGKRCRVVVAKDSSVWMWMLLAGNMPYEQVFPIVLLHRRPPPLPFYSSGHLLYRYIFARYLVYAPSWRYISTNSLLPYHWRIPTSMWPPTCELRCKTCHPLASTIYVLSLLCFHFGKAEGKHLRWIQYQFCQEPSQLQFQTHPLSLFPAFSSWDSWMDQPSFPQWVTFYSRLPNSFCVKNTHEISVPILWLARWLPSSHL